ncbi:MAG: hypothetical protein MUE53_07730, partial [Chitinophagales bacterium]|nr:hypothetical protein [Chitinophagales bacterium]
TAAADLTTVDIEGKSNGFIITVNGKKDTFIPPIGTIGDKILGFDAAGNIVKGVLKKEKIVCAGTRTQVINNSNVSSNSTILLSYQDPSRIIYPAILSINPGVSFTVQFSSIPPTSAILHYTIID